MMGKKNGVDMYRGYFLFLFLFNGGFRVDYQKNGFLSSGN